MGQPLTEVPCLCWRGGQPMDQESKQSLNSKLDEPCFAPSERAVRHNPIRRNCRITEQMVTLPLVDRKSRFRVLLLGPLRGDI
jgi:hypothetical protein